VPFTRLYLGANTPSYTPATVRGAWDDIAGAVTRALVQTKIDGDFITSITRTETSASSEWDVLLYRGVSAPLAAQTISGTLDLVVGVDVDNAAADFCWHVHLYVTQGDTDTPRGTLLNDYVEVLAQEWPATDAGKALLEPQPLTPLAISAGDRLVVELGYIARNTSTASRAGEIYYGTKDPATFAPGGDLTAGSLTPGTQAGFLNFSASITEISPLSARVTHDVVEVLTWYPAPARITQAVIEVLTGPLVSSMVTQHVIEVLTFVPEVEQRFQDGGVSHPLTWITLTKKDGVKCAYAEVDLNDPPQYYDGYKRPRVERFHTIARGLSDRDGQVEHMSFGALLSDIATDRFDTHREFRAMLADAVNKYLTNRPLEVWFVDDTERRVLGLPRLAALGFVNDYAPTADLHFELKGADWLKKKFSRKRRAQQGWQPLITVADFPACPIETLETPAPIIYGSLGLTGVDASAVVGVTVTVGPQPVAAPANFDLELRTGGKTAGVTRYYTMSAYVGGVETDQTPVLAERTTNTMRTIRVNWDAVPGAEFYRIYSSHRSDFLQGALLDVDSSVTQYDDTTVLPNENREWITDTNWLLMLRQNFQYLVYANLGGGVFSAPGIGGVVITPIADRREVPSTRIQRNITISWTAHPGAVDGYRIIRRRSYYSDWDAEYNRQWDVAAGVLSVNDDNVVITPVTVPTGDLVAVEAAGQAKAIFVGQGTYGTTPITVSAFLVARHACARVGNIYIPTTTDAGDGETKTTYAPVPDAAFGVTWFAPDHPGWIYPTKYVAINGQWFTLIFTTVEPAPDPVFVDVDGVETAADGTGTLIRSIVDQRLHFMVNFVAPDTPWLAGAYLTAGDTVFPQLPAIPLVDEASHAAVKAALAARLGGSDYEGATIIGAGGEFVTAVDALARFQQSGDFDQTFNRKGQDSVSCEPIAASENLATITDVLNVRESSFNLVDQVQSAFFNILPYVHSRDYTGREQGGWYGKGEVRSNESIANYDQERESPKFELHALRGNTAQGRATITDVMARKLARFQDPRRIGSLQLPFAGLNFEPGETAAITHLEGVGADGWVGREVRFTRHEVEPTAGIVRLDFYDLTAVLENHAALLRRRQPQQEGDSHGKQPDTAETRVADRPAAADPDAPHRGTTRPTRPAGTTRPAADAGASHRRRRSGEPRSTDAPPRVTRVVTEKERRRRKPPPSDA
jgi:hypothetical protein